MCRSSADDPLLRWLTLALALSLPASVEAQSVDSTLWGFGPGDRVLAIAPAGDTVYLGGSFRYVGPSTGGGVPLSACTALPVAPYPRVVGRVEQVLADGSGGWFVGGLFTHVGSQPRRNLAHILADGSVSDWAPNPSAGVWAMTLAGQTLYVGGDFDSVAGQPRLRLAAIDREVGTALPWRCDADDRISAILVDGSTVFIGGWFTMMAGQSRTYVAAVDATTGALSPWQVQLDARVRALAIRDTTLYIGGYFFNANDVPRMGLIAVGSTSGHLHAWDPMLTRTPFASLDGGPHVHALLLSGDSLYVAGSFSSLGGQPRRGLAQLDLATALATEWNPRGTRPVIFGPDFWSLVRSGDTLFVAGAFDSLGGRPRSAGLQAAALDARTGERLAWDPDANDFIFALGVQGGVVYVGGLFSSVGEWVVRRGLAAIDMRTGRVTSWDPNPNDYVRSVLFHDGKVYAGGYFTSVGGQPRSFLAALDPVTGQATAWDPRPNDSVWTMAPLGSDLIVGGRFSSIGGQARQGVAVVDTLAGLATSWDARLLGEVYDVAVTDSCVYVGGFILSVAGQTRHSLAALRLESGSLLPWNPGADGSISALVLLDGTIYVGGKFDVAGGQPRRYLAGIDGSGVATAWDPGLYGPVPYFQLNALAGVDSTLFIGGYFSGLAGTPREYLAAVNTRSGQVIASYPTFGGAIDGSVWAIEVDAKKTALIGGAFGRVGSLPQISFAAIRPAPPPESPGGGDFARLFATPNPAQRSTTIRFTLPTSQLVSLTVFDLQGRVVAKPLRRTVQSAGAHQIPLSTVGWQAGCYLYRLESGGRSATRKLVVVR